MNVALVHPAWRTPNQLDSFYPGRVYWTLTLKEFFSRNTSTGARLMNVALVHPVWRTLNQLDSFCPGRVCWAYTLKEFFQEHIKNLGVAALEDEMVCCNTYIYMYYSSKVWQVTRWASIVGWQHCIWSLLHSNGLSYFKVGLSNM